MKSRHKMFIKIFIKIRICLIIAVIRKIHFFYSVNEREHSKSTFAQDSRVLAKSKVKSKIFPFNHFHDLQNWPLKKRSLKFNFTTPLYWYSVNHKRLQINTFNITQIGGLVWAGESDRTQFVDRTEYDNFSWWFV